MSFIKIDLGTNEEGDIAISMKAECNLNELEVATGYLMGALVSQSTTGLEVVEALIEDIKRNSNEKVNNLIN